ncbi:MAG: hypothetical protein WAU42_05190 [Solirubrobacteraceae bacterium]
MSDGVVKDLAHRYAREKVQLRSLRTLGDLNDLVSVPLDEPHCHLDPVEHAPIALLALNCRPALVVSAKPSAPDLRIGKMDCPFSPK